MKFQVALVTLLAFLAFTGASSAQDINVDFGPTPVPSASYGAASGQVGAWNAIGVSPALVQLVDVAGQPTSVFGGPTFSFSCDMYDCSACAGAVCAGFSGSADDQALLGSWINADCGAGATQLGFSGLESGRYAAYVYTYGCPSAPGVQTNLLVEGAYMGFDTTGVTFQGTWTGFPVGRHVFNLSSGSFTISAMGVVEAGIAGLQLDKLDPVGVASCLGDGTGGNCPCANFGQPGEGCRNSASTHGALLGAVGAPSMAFDTLGFQCASVPAGVAALLLQGDQMIAPIAFGDGLRCIGGHLKRLYLANASASGALSLPPNIGLSVSARSAQLGDALAPGSLRGYQLYYRDNSASFCPAPQGSTYNISNAVEITWQL